MQLRLLFIFTASVFALALPRGAFAHPPIVTITTNAQQQLSCSQAFPFATTIAFTIQSEDISRTKNVAVSVNGVYLPGFPTGTPRTFDASTGSCTALMDSLTTSCSVSGDTATAAVPFTVPSPGSYLVRVTANWGDPLGVAEKTLQFIAPSNCNCDKHQPAPPAIANAYINAQGYVVNNQVRGCIIKQIALNHAQDEKYGPKSGPYDEDLIHSDVNAYLATCTNQVTRTKRLVKLQRSRR